jgi:hypothetical protein
MSSAHLSVHRLGSLGGMVSAIFCTSASRVSPMSQRLGALEPSAQSP